MAFTPIVVGSLAWGGPVNAAFASQDARITDIERQGASTLDAMGFLAMTFDPALTQGSISLTSGTVSMARIDLPAAATVNTITVGSTTAGSGLVAGQSFAGLYDSAGTRVAVSADQSASWASTGEKNVALTAPYAAAAGTYYVGLLCNGTTPISFVRGSTGAPIASLVNHGLTAATARWATGPTSQTTLPASITMASRTLSPTAYFVALS